MASIIRIKRSQVSGNPSTLAAGELAYSALEDNGSNGGDRLYIGIGTETAGNAANHLVIGGKFFTDRLDHTAGTLTASSAIVVDSNSKIDQLNVDNITIDGNTISSTNTNGNVVLDPNGTGVVQVTGDLTVTGVINASISAQSADKWTTARDLSLTGDATATLEDVDGTGNVSAALTLATVNTNTGSFGSSTAIPVLTVNAKGLVTAVTTESISTSFSLAGDTGTDTFNNGGTLTFTGTNPVQTAVTNDTVTISVDDASTSSKGIAQFSDNDFSVTGGVVTIKASGVDNSQLANDSVTIGSTEVDLGATVTAFAGLTQVDVDNIRVDGNTVSTTNTNGNLVLAPNGTGKVSIASAYTLPNADGTAGQLLVTDGSGVVSFQSPASSSFTIEGDTGTDTFNTGETLTFAGTGPLSAAVTDNTVTFSVADATTTDKGVASFDSSSFDVTSGAVSIKTAGISNSQLANASVTFGTTEVALGGSSTSIAGVTELTVDNLNLNGSTISATGEATDISITLDPKGAGSVDVNGARITNVGAPTQATDAVTKSYVDAVTEGLHIHAGVDAATPDTLATLSGGTVTYSNGTDGVGATLTLEIGLSTLDGYTLANGDRILVKNEATAAHNGIYVRTSATVLTRATDYDTDAEVAGGDFTFVTNGTLYNSTGWVQIDPVNVIGTDPINFTQFSGAGTYLPGDGLSLSGNEFNVNLSTTGGLEFSGSNAIQLKSTVAGDGLTITEGVVAVGGTTDRISVSADAVDIASTYVGQTSITTLGTVATGTWNATTIATTKGGTGLTSYATGDLIYASASNTLAKLAAGDDGKVLQMNSSGVPVWGDIDGGTY